MENPPLFADIPIETSILGDFPASHVWVREGNHNFVDPFFDTHMLTKMVGDVYRLTKTVTICHNEWCFVTISGVILCISLGDDYIKQLQSAEWPRCGRMKDLRTRYKQVGFHD